MVGCTGGLKVWNNLLVKVLSAYGRKLETLDNCEAPM